MILPTIEKELYFYMTRIAKSHGPQIHEIGGMEDHVHLLTSLPRALSISKFMEEIKKRSSRWIKIKGSLYTSLVWQSGYRAFSIGQSECENLRSYIQMQKNYHKPLKFQKEYRIFLKKYRAE